MKTTPVYIALVVGLTATLLPAQENLLSNGGFEDGRTGWTLSVNSNGDDSGRVAAASYEIDSTSGDAKEGSKYYRLTVTSVSSENWHVQLKDPTWVAQVGYVYHFSFWARSDSARPSQISVYGSATNRDEYRTSSSISLTTEWKQYHQIFKADAEGPGQHNFAIVCGFQPGVYEFDGAAVTEEPPSDNIYSNGSFEADAAGWTLFKATGTGATAAGTMTIVNDATEAQDGSKFCRIAVTNVSRDSSDKVINWHIQLQDGSWTVDSGFVYTFSFYGKADKSFSVHVCAQGGAASNYAYYKGTDVVLSQDWEQYDFSYTAASSGKDSLSFNIYLGTDTGTVDLDNITLTGTDPTKVTSLPLTGSVVTTQSLRMQAFPRYLRIITPEIVGTPSRITIHDLQGRLFIAQSLTPGGRVFDLPRPPEGTWIVRLNENRGRMITIR